MERATRLRRYLRKDYTQVVEFPVEIVGRDGLVRRYSFDDSVRLYQRRIHSAPMRYDDGDLVDAEVRHCRQRIDQLRRSYLEHFGWGALRDGQLGGVFAGPLAAEIAAFLRRAFAAERDGPTSLQLTLVESGVGETCYLQCRQSGRSWLLYVWRIDGEGPTGAREAWRQAVTRLAIAPVGETVERLLLASDGPELALVLAGAGDWSGPVSHAGPEEPPTGADAPDPLHAGIRALYDGHATHALRILEAGLDGQPARLMLAQATALVALLEQAPERAEFAARFGRLHRPTDPLLAYLLGVALARQGRLEEAAGVVDETRAVAPRSAILSLLLGVFALREGRLVGAWRAFSTAMTADREPRYAARAAGVMRNAMLRWAAFTWSGAAAGTFGAAWALSGAPAAGIAVVCAGVVSVAGAAVGLARTAEAAASGEKRRSVPRLVSLELLPRDREIDQHN
ncbi:MAG: hypothetical protein Q8P41_10105 [Pseudomonadota bacterium]|nr:hypothetical protein [Pseudomonadota bacterium]